MERPNAPRDHRPVDWGEVLNKGAGLLIRWGGLAFVVCLAYFGYAIFGGVLQSADPSRAVGLISSFGVGLVLSAFALALGLILLTREEVTYAVIVGVAGVGLMLGLPYLVASNLSRNLTPEMRSVVAALSGFGTNAGLAVLLAVGGRVLYEVVAQVKEAPERRRQRAEKETLEEGGLKKRKPLKPMSVISRCWELPFCHERIRELCPAFKHHRTCWRYGIGCNCDPKLIESLIRLGAPGKGPASAEMKGRQAAYVRSDLQADVVVGDKTHRTIACARCPIYTEHQRLKFRFVNPVAIIGTIVLMGLLYMPIMAVFTAVASGIAQVASDISINQRVNAGQWFDYLNTDSVKVFFFIILALLVLSYVLKFMEWVVLDKKL